MQCTLLYEKIEIPVPAKYTAVLRHVIRIAIGFFNVINMELIYYITS